MRYSLALLAAAVMIGAPASAKMTTVKGAKCVACHEGAPKDKKLNKAAQEWLKKSKEEQCKDCHVAEGGALGLNDKGKAAKKK